MPFFSERDLGRLNRVVQFVEHQMRNPRVQPTPRAVLHPGNIKAHVTVYLTSAQSIGTGSAAYVSWDAISESPDSVPPLQQRGLGIWNVLDPTKFVAPVDGLYEMGCTVVWDGGATGTTLLQAIVEAVNPLTAWGRAFDARRGASGDLDDVQAQTLNTKVWMEKDSYFRISVEHDSDSSRNLVSNTGLNQMTAAWCTLLG